MVKFQYLWSEMSRIMRFFGQILGKSAGVKDLTNIMSEYTPRHMPGKMVIDNVYIKMYCKMQFWSSPVLKENLSKCLFSLFMGGVEGWIVTKICQKNLVSQVNLWIMPHEHWAGNGHELNQRHKRWIRLEVFRWFRCIKRRWLLCMLWIWIECVKTFASSVKSSESMKEVNLNWICQNFWISRI